MRRQYLYSRQIVFLKKAATFVLLFSFVISPITPVFAQEVPADSVLAPSPAADNVTPDPIVPAPNVETPNEPTVLSAIDPIPDPLIDVLPSDTESEILDEKKEPKEEKEEKEKPKNEEVVPDPEEKMMMQSLIEPEEQTLGRYVAPQVSVANGSLNYTYPIVVPPGRNGLTPKVAFSYSSSNKSHSSLVGHGWSLDIPYIQRVNKKGTDVLYTEDYFMSSLDGDLIDQEDGTFKPRTENGTNLKYVYANDYWTVTDKNGTQYRFGSTTQARQDNPDDATQIFGWMIETVTDTNGNTINYTYYKDQGQIYPDTITYNQEGLFEITFTRTARATDYTSYIPAFEVVSSYFISGVTVEADSSVVSEYDITTDGSLVTELTLTGSEGVSSLALPSTEFAYSTTASTTDTYARNGSYDLPYYMSGSDKIAVEASGGNTHVFVDIDGDGLTDFIRSNSAAYETAANGGALKAQYGVWINNGTSGFTRNGAIDLPYYMSGSDKIALEVSGSAKAFSDVDGDGLADLVSSYSTAYETAANGGALKANYGVWLNTGSGFSRDAGIDLPYYLSGSDKIALELGGNVKAFADINGDGLSDLIASYDSAYETAANGGALKDAWGIWLNNGDGYTRDPDMPLPYYMSGSNKIALEVAGAAKAFTDVNGDGLTDLVSSYDTAYETAANGGALKANYGVWLNTGYGYEKSSMGLPYYMSGSDKIALPASGGNRFAYLDVNGDGLADLMSSYSTAYETAANGGAVKTAYGVWLNVGDGYTKDTSIDLPYYMSGSDKIALEIGGSAKSLADVNGDGLTDIVSSYSSAYETAANGGALKSNYGIWFNTGSRFADIATTTDSRGGTSAFTYTSARIQDASNSVPFPVLVVDSITTNDNSGNTYTTDYEYRDASFYYGDPFDKRFAGFGEVQEIQDDGSKKVTFYHQADGNTTNESGDSYARIGKPYRSEVLNDEADLFLREVTLYTDTELVNDAFSIQASSTLRQQYDGTGSHTDTATEYEYDAYGNITTETQYGVVSGAIGGTFTDSGSDKREITQTFTSDTTNYIVGLPESRVLKDNSGTKVSETLFSYDVDGNLETKSDWITGSNYSDTDYTYNSYGLPLTKTDALANVTEYAYDSHNLYPDEVTNDLSQVTLYEYDYSSGKVASTTEPTGKNTTYDYDALDRLIEVEETIANGSPATVKAFTYNTSSYPQSTTQTVHFNGTDTRDIHTYLNGLGQTIQQKFEVDGGYATFDTGYNHKGKVDVQSLPYLSTSASSTNATTTADLLTTYLYDALDRVASSTNAKGTTFTTYDGFTSTVTDPETNVKDFTTDAFNNLVSVDEHNNSSTYTTEYTYSPLNLLTSITDEDNNLRNITYDGMGRRTEIEDLHTSADTTFGSWTFSYDDLNMLTKTDPKNATTTYTYDGLNRVATEDSSTAAGTEITYTYDSCTNGTGKLCSVATPDITTAYTYFKQGQRAGETRTIDSVGYVTSHTYDRQGNVTQTTHPNSAVTVYDYGVNGKVSDITHASTLLATIDYGVHGKPETITYGNGVVSTFTYDDNNLYELTNKQSETSGSAIIQDLTYTYDSVGNITDIVDDSGGQSDRTMEFGYDDLYRLTSVLATSTANNQNYSHTYAYSPIGNITSFNGTSYTYTDSGYSNPHAATAIGAQAQTYDNSGNLTNDGTWTHVWDYRNRIASSTNGTTTLTYKYDHEDSRIKVVDGGVTTIYPNDSYETTGGVPTISLYADNLLIATYSNATTTYIHTDHLGGTHVATDGNQAVTQTLDYFPFGEVRLDIGSTTESRQYIGEVYDSTTELNYLNARYLSGQRGQFLGQDPVFWEVGQTSDGNSVLRNPQLQNSYSYAGNNPITYKDPTGRYLESGFDVAMLGISIASFANNPSWSNAAGVALDVGSLALPGVPAVGGMAVRGTKIANQATDAAKATQIGKNAAQGRAYEETVFKEFQKTVSDAVQQLTIKTDSGVKTRVDIAGRNSNGTPCLVECKSSPGAPLTPNQTKAFPEIEQSGGTVMGQGKPGFPGGTRISPTPVKVKRPE